MVDLRQSQAEKLQEALDMGELDTGKGLKQELGLARAADTRWGSHYKFSKNIINMFGSIIDVLDTIVVDARSLEERAKHGIVIPNFDEFYVNSGRSRRKVAEHTISHHYRVNVFIKIIDWQLHELKERFNEETTDLLMGVACLNPVDSFSSFDIKKILRMAELYPDDFDENSMITLENKLATYIVDIRDVDERFSNLKGLSDLSEKLVKTKKHLNYPFVFRLVKYVLLLPVATATVERAFSAMKLINSELRNRLNDEFMSSCLVPYVEREMFNSVSDETIMNRFHEMKTHRVQLD
ncbi:uncharacterized protein LOC107772782 [Nicotiana tabacum]|uniref:uncharacterized protein LOC107772782 n=1 Tax=Nicotiana tabacum TaxID=4097 RepID=UPI003F4ED282